MKSLSSIQLSAHGAHAEIFLQGAHVSRFVTTNGAEILFLSAQSRFENGRAIRGGVPLIFPWFGPKIGDSTAPAHGFARTMEWQIADSAADSALLILSSNEATLAVWPHPFRLEYRVEIGAEKLGLKLQIHNTGAAAFGFETALHTYFRVSDARTIEIDGLDGKTYLDKTQGMARLTQSGPIQISGETDRVYLDSSGPIALRDGARTVTISNLDGVKSSVVWNPWLEKSRAMSDLGDDEWPDFVCIESGVIADDAEVLGAGKSYEMAVEIAVSQ